MLTEEILAKWTDWSRRDDAFNLFVPSDIRQMLGEIYRLRKLDEPRPRSLDLSKEYVLRGGMQVVSLVENPTGYDVRAIAVGPPKHEFGFKVRGDGTYGFNKEYDVLPKL